MYLTQDTVFQVSSFEMKAAPLREEELWFWLGHGEMAAYGTAEDPECHNAALLGHAPATAFTTHLNPMLDGPTAVTTTPLQYKLVGTKSNRRPRAATKLLRKSHEGPCVWLAYREERYLFSTHIVTPYFLTFVRRVHSQTFEGGIDAPRFLVNEWVIGNRIDRVMLARDAGARCKLI